MNPLLKKKWIKITRLFILALCLLVLIIYIGLYFTQLPFTGLPIPEKGSIVLDQKGFRLGFFTNNRGEYFLPIQEVVPPNVTRAILAAEDKNYFRHFGVDILASSRAFFTNCTQARRVSGASTITMQFIRLQTNYPRTYLNKLKEAWFAIKLETLYSKEDILKAYLNCAPFGGNIVGFETACYYYFGKSSADLSIEQLVLISGLPQSPNRLRPDRHLQKAVIRRNKILKRMLHLNYISELEYREYKNKNVNLDAYTYSSKTNLVAFYIRNQTNQTVIRTNIDIDLQYKVDKAANEFSKSYNLNYDHCVLVLGQDGRLLAYYESNIENYFGSAAFQKRSPGSCLKPFIYAKAFESGICWPEKILEDSPMSFYDYRPQNADKQFYLQISSSLSLQLSRNLPSVQLLNSVGVKSFYSFLQSLHLVENDSKNDSGLSIALGGKDVSLIDLTNAYSMIARNGLYSPYLLTKNSKRVLPQQVLNQDSIAQLKSCLIKNDSPLFYAKTGTSWGPRDIWCIGFNNQYTVGVWIGKKSGGTLPNINSRDHAMPLLREVFRLFQTTYEVNKIMGTTVALCSETGYRASSNCKAIRETEFFSKVLPELCALHTSCKFSYGSTSKKFSILSPLSNVKYLLDKKNSLYSIEVTSNTSNQNLYWFLNGQLLSRERRFFLKPEELHHGLNQLSVIDELGHKATVEFNVEFM